MRRVKWGEAGHQRVDLYTLTNRSGLVAKITNYGATVTELHVPDAEGSFGDVVFGFDNLADYVRASRYFGATIGRVANRIANAQFELGAKTYDLAANGLPHHLHGGEKGWDKVIWDAEAAATSTGPALKLTYVSRDGEEGYPGNVTATTLYTLTEADELRVEMGATTDAITIINMAHHSYWNLRGTPDGDIRDHVLTLHAERYTPGMPPDGTIARVADTPFDFRTPKPIGRDLEIVAPPRAGAPVGYDHNWIVDGDPSRLRAVARLEEPESGRTMTLHADQPGVQFYAGLFLDGSTAGKGRTHDRYGALCLESQLFPNSINVPAWRAGAILEPGRTYRHVMIHRFATRARP